MEPLIRKMIKNSAIMIVTAIALSSCSSSEKKSKVHPAVLSAQDLMVDNGMPVREIKKQEPFFFKKCEVDNTGPWPTKTTYDCNEL